MVFFYVLLYDSCESRDVVLNRVKSVINTLEKKGYLEIFLYVFFGGLTTLVNFIVYFICRELFQSDFIISNTISWILSVTFAFVTNKLWVFHSKTDSFIALLIEFFKFVFYRLLSFGIDMGSMFILLKWLDLNDYIAKAVTQILVIVSNYFFSKLFIFKNTDKIIEVSDDEKKDESQAKKL
jgi:putative flippase GtrA